MISAINCLNLADVQLAEIRKKCLLFTKRLLVISNSTVLRSFESFVSCSSRLFFSCCWVLAAISSFFASLNSSNVVLCSNFVASFSHNVAVHLLKKLFQYTQYFTPLTGILRDILAGSSGL